MFYNSGLLRFHSLRDLALSRDGRAAAGGQQQQDGQDQPHALLPRAGFAAGQEGFRRSAGGYVPDSRRLARLLFPFQREARTMLRTVL